VQSLFHEQLHEANMLTDTEFAAAKAILLV
jgi:hypothetical protein